MPSERLVQMLPIRIDGGNYDRKLFAKLRKLRKSIADESNVPPYDFCIAFGLSATIRGTAG